jgi:tetratricopeptide (TPR) repeat protein
VLEQRKAAAYAAEGLNELSRATVASNERAVQLFERAVSVDAGFGVAYMGLASAHVQRTDDLGLGPSWLEPAVKAGRRAIELDPSLGDAYVALGRAYRIRGWLREELQLWQRRTRLDDSDPNAKEKIGWVLWFTGRADESLRWLQAALALRPEGRWTHFFLGNANLSLRRFDEAERMYAKALELNPDHSSAQAGVIWTLLAAHRDEVAGSHLRRFQMGAFDGDRYALKLADIEYFLGEEDNASLHARQALAEPEERYWPRGFLASTILGAVLWRADRADAEEQLGQSEKIDHERLDGGDQGYMPHIDLSAVAAIRGDRSAACSSLRAAIAAGWRYPSLAGRDRLLANLRTDHEFISLVAA